MMRHLAGALTSGLALVGLGTAAVAQPAEAPIPTECVRQAASQVAGRAVQASEARDAVRELAKRIAQPTGAVNAATRQTLYVTCLVNGTIEAYRAGPPAANGVQHADQDIRASINLAWRMARLVGLDGELARALGAQSVGQFPALTSVGLMPPGARGVYYPSTNVTGVSDQLSVAGRAAVLVHEWSHYLFTLNTRANRRTGQKSTVTSLVINEAHSFALQMTAAYAVSLLGEPAPFREIDSAGVLGDRYRSIILAVAQSHPDLRRQIAVDGRVPKAFLADVFKRVIEQPTAGHMRQYKDVIAGAGRDTLTLALLNIYFLDARDIEPTVDALENSIWYGVLRKHKPGADLFSALESDTADTFLATALDSILEQSDVQTAATRKGSAFELNWRIREKIATFGAPDRLERLNVTPEIWQVFLDKLQAAGTEDALHAFNTLALDELRTLDLGALVMLTRMAKHLDDVRKTRTELASVYTDVVAPKWNLVSLWANYRVLATARSQAPAEFIAKTLLGTALDFTYFRVDANDRRTSRQIADEIFFIEALGSNPAVEFDRIVGSGYVRTKVTLSELITRLRLETKQADENGIRSGLDQLAAARVALAGPRVSMTDVDRALAVRSMMMRWAWLLDDGFFRSGGTSRAELTTAANALLAMIRNSSVVLLEALEEDQISGLSSDQIREHSQVASQALVWLKSQPKAEYDKRILRMARNAQQIEAFRLLDQFKQKKDRQSAIDLALKLASFGLDFSVFGTPPFLRPSSTVATELGVMEYLTAAPELSVVVKRQLSVSDHQLKDTPIQHACADEPTLRSQSFVFRTAVQVVNKSTQAKTLYWIEQSGTRKQFQVLAAGANTTINGNSGLYWVITNPNGACAMVFQPRRHATTLVLQ